MSDSIRCEKVGANDRRRAGLIAALTVLSVQGSLFAVGLACRPNAAAAEEKPAAETRYIKVVRQPLSEDPGGRKLGELYTNAPVVVQEIRGDWARVALEGWVKRSSLSGSDKEVDPRDVTTTNDTGFFIKSFDIYQVKQPGAPSRVYLKLILMNATKQPVYRWKGILVAKDHSGKVLFSETVTDEKASVPYGSTREVSFFWEPNEAPYEPLMVAEHDKTSIKLELLKLQLTQQ